MTEEIKWSMTLDGDTDNPDFQFLASVIEDEINGVPKGWLEFTCRNKTLDLGKYVGGEMGYWIEDENGKRRSFFGTCVSLETVGEFHGGGHYLAEVRPWLWFLTRSKNNRIYQNKKTTDIIKDILGDYGFSGDLKVQHSGTDPEREYCVQYRETDLDFIKRLMEEEGFYYFFEYEDSAVKMILHDQPSGHPAPTEDDKYLYADEIADLARERITKWQKKEAVVTGKVTLRDFDFTKPSSDLTATSTSEKGDHAHKSYEVYHYPGRYTDVSHGEAKAADLIEAEAAGHQVWEAEGSIANLAVGKLFEIVDHPRHTKASDNGFMVKKLLHYMRTSTENNVAVESVLRKFKGLAHMTERHFASVFEAVLKTNPFRMPLFTPKPDMSGLQTAIVTGAGGDEICVDKYGRIKVQFHWDREGKNDDKTTCWIRTVMPWTGKGWGGAFWPRVGQEVVIQFLEGDPDRPVCTGMLYNADTMPPYELPADKTMSGIKTNSSKGGGGYNELMFEDKKGDELVRFMAEKDFVQNVQRSSHTKVGYAHPNDVRAANAQGSGSVRLDIYNHLDETLEKGDHTFKVEDGNQTIEIKKDHEETIEGKATQTVTKDHHTEIKQGNMSEEIKMGNQTTEIKMGDQKTTLDLGNITTHCKLGKIKYEAMQSIELKVMGSSIKIDPSGVTIKGPMIKIEGDAMVQAKAPVTTVNGDAMLVLKGGITKVN